MRHSCHIGSQAFHKYLRFLFPIKRPKRNLCKSTSTCCLHVRIKNASPKITHLILFWDNCTCRLTFSVTASTPMNIYRFHFIYIHVFWLIKKETQFFFFNSILVNSLSILSNLNPIDNAAAFCVDHVDFSSINICAYEKEREKENRKGKETQFVEAIERNKLLIVACVGMH